jgi:hypothetical protein
VVSLGDSYKLVDQLDELGVPSLIACNSLTLEGRVTFEPGVLIAGDVKILSSPDAPKPVVAGEYRDLTVQL